MIKPKEIQILLVGGFGDGKVLKIDPDCSYVYVPEPYAPLVYANEDCFKPTSTFKQHMYKKQKLYFENTETIYLMVWEGISLKEAFGSLIKNYKPKEEDYE